MAPEVDFEFRGGVALLSAFKKDAALRDFARGLVRLDWTIWASSGTKKFLDENSVPSLDIADFVGEPILGHRVVTLDRRIYAALLSRDVDPADEQELERLGVDRIDLVYVDLYPLKDELEKQASNPVGIIKQYHACLEKIDIGGPTLLRAAAKGGRYAVAAPELLESTLRHLQGGSDIHDAKFRNSLAAMAEMTVSKYAMTAFGFYQSLVDGTFPEVFQK